jgi:photosystem II stability/assembly factor-like uncharacterized protein
MAYQFKIFVYSICLIVCSESLLAQTVNLLSSGTKSSLRGLSVVNDRIIWVSGSNGMVGKSIDSGKTFIWQVVKGYEKTEFRDIEAFNDSTALIMGIESPAYILRTTNGGVNWKKVYENNALGMFLDAMEFLNSQNGIVIGDPLEGRIFMAKTFDGGNSWKDLPLQNNPIADSGEAFFASSGTNIRKLNQQEAVFVSGGKSSHLFINGKKILVPIIQGKQSTGANSIAVKNNRTLIVVGGDFNTKDSNINNCFITKNAGKDWYAPEIPLHGYRSCVEWLNKKNWISCGLNGVDFSKDDGNTWNWISKESYHVCRKSKKGKSVFFAGTGGRIGKLIDF